MKPAKKHDTKKNEKKDIPTSQIKSYFKPAPKSFVVQTETENHSDGPKQFYVDALKEKLQSKIFFISVIVFNDKLSIFVVKIVLNNMK